MYNSIKIEDELKFVFDRDVAQFGSAPVLGTGGRRFESCHPDFTKNEINFCGSNLLNVTRSLGKLGDFLVKKGIYILLCKNVQALIN